MLEAALRQRMENRRRAAGPAAADPSLVFALKALLYPVVSTVVLILCVMVRGQPLGGLNFAAVAFGFVVTANVLGVARLRRRTDPASLAWPLVWIVNRWLVVVAILVAVAYLAGLQEQLDGPTYLTWFVATPLVTWGAQCLAQSWLASHARNDSLGRAVIVGLTDAGLRLEASLRDEVVCGPRVLGYFEDRTAGRLPPGADGKVLGKLPELLRYIAEQDVNTVYVTLPMSRHARMRELLEGLQDSTASIYFVPDVYTFDPIQGRVDVVGGMPLVAVRESPFYGARAIAKRASDIVISATLIALLLPVLLVTALGVRLSSPGPVIFRQKRYGLDGRPIMVSKFRSMRIQENGVTQFTAARRGDSRVTPFGAFIRKTSIDELPQLFNVLRGSMSIVGPRPHPVAMNEQYRRLIPGYMIRHKVKPGITGWAQVNGYRGGDDLESMRKRIEYDLDYLRRWSLTLDLLIMIWTAAVVLRDENAY